MPAKQPTTPILQFEADAYAVRGPSVDGGYKITFSTGELEQLNIAKLLTIPQQVPLKITVEVEE